MKDSLDAFIHPHQTRLKRSPNDWSFTQQQWGSVQRNTYLSMLDDCFQWLAANPLKGKDCGEIRRGYRKMNAGSHVVFYRQKQGDAIEIVRILHGRMDFDTRLPTEENRSSHAES